MFPTAGKKPAKHSRFPFSSIAISFRSRLSALICSKQEGVRLQRPPKTKPPDLPKSLFL